MASVKASGHNQTYYARNRDRLREQARLRMRRLRQEDPERVRSRKLKATFGITGEDYAWMLHVQNGVCAICKKPETIVGNGGAVKKLTVDHCHKTGEVRGLLCQRCNSILGYSGDEPLVLIAAAEYLGG